MTTYVIKDSDGNTVATIGPGSTTGTTFPITLTGAGVSPYGQFINTSFYHLLENFTSSGTQPSSPVTGMLWYDKSKDILYYYDGTRFVPLNWSCATSLFPMDASATAVDLTTAGTTTVFTHPGTGDVYRPTAVKLIPNGTVSATGPAILNLSVIASEDVLENVSVTVPNDKSYAYYIIQGTTRSVNSGESLKLEVVSPATGGALSVDVYVYGTRM